MTLPRRLVGVLWSVVGGLVLVVHAAAGDSPKLSKTQKATLEAVIAAVDAPNAVDRVIPNERLVWQTHVLRASDGSHYVAVKAHVTGEPAPTTPVVLYVRLSSRQPEATRRTTLERSAVLQWLRGRRSDPLPMRAARSTTVNPGEMPIGGTATAVGDVGADATAALRLVSLQQERSERLRKDAETQRRQELEDAAERRSTLFPFEDFDAAAEISAALGGFEVARGITAGPGEYDLTMSWASLPARGAPDVSPIVIRHRLTLNAATSDFQLADVVVASVVTPLATPFSASQQAAHPYAFGAISAVPALANRLSAEGTLGLIYQVVNASGTAAGKPDVEVGLQVFRIDADRETAFARLETQRHHEANLPLDFDIAKGHPLFGAVRAPLTTFRRGRYRVEVTAVDRLAGRKVTSEAQFDVVGTLSTLLREAPALGQTFRRDVVLAWLGRALVDRLAPATPSSGMQRLLQAAREGRYAALVQTEALAPDEQGRALALRALGLFGLGDSPGTTAALLPQAAAQGAPTLPLTVLRGVLAAANGDDRTAIADWRAAREQGFDETGLAAAITDASLRLGRPDEAVAIATTAYSQAPSDAAVVYRLAAVQIATRRYAEALTTLSARPVDHGLDLDGDFLVLQALFGGFATGPAIAPVPLSRFHEAATAYVAAGGRHAPLVADWQQALAMVVAGGTSGARR